MTLTSIRWVVIRIVERGEDHKATEVLGEVQAPNRDAALALAGPRYGGVGLAVISRVSWDMSQEERARLERRRPAHLGSLNGRGGSPRRLPPK